MEQKGLSRRSFLQLMAGSTAAAIAATVPSLSVAAQDDMMYSDAPMLQDLVSSGDLPPVAERIPTNPRVITPFEQIGQYGGTWRRAFTGLSDRWGPIKLNEEMAIEWDAPDADTINLIANYISEWTQNDDATEFTFTLREGLKWSDGEDFNTEDVQFWYDHYYLADHGQKQAFFTLTVDGEAIDMDLEVVDNLSWTVRFPAPNPLLPISIAKLTGGLDGGPTMAIPEHYMRDYLPDMTSDQSLIDDAIAANGVASWQELWGDGGGRQGPILFWFRNPDMPVISAWRALNSPTEDPHVMERNPYYHAVDPDGQQLPYIDRIEHALMADQSVMDLWIAQGRIDMQARRVAASNFTFYKENEEAGNYRVLIWKAAETNALHPNTSHLDPRLRQLFNDATFREALSISIDRDEINNLVYNGLFEPRQASPISGSPEYDPEFETRWIEFDVDRANELLDSMGMADRDADGWRLHPDGDPFEFRILHRSVTGEPGSDEMQLVEGYWKAIGLNVSQDVVERSLYEERLRTGDVDVGVWGADRNSVVKADPGRYIGITDDGPWAVLYGHWYDTASTDSKEEPPADHPIWQIWDLWEQTQVEPDEATRNALFKQLLDIHKEHPYMIGTVGEAPQPVIVSNNMVNVPNLYIWDDTMRSPGYTLPAQYSFISM